MINNIGCRPIRRRKISVRLHGAAAHTLDNWPGGDVHVLDLLPSIFLQIRSVQLANVDISSRYMGACRIVLFRTRHSPQPLGTSPSEFCTPRVPPCSVAHQQSRYLMNHSLGDNLSAILKWWV